MTDEFEDHCWRDIVPADILDIYSHYERKTFVGPAPALIAIDLYELAYQGGAKPVAELHRTYPSSCGEYAYAAIEPTKRLFAAARRAGLPVFYSTMDTRTDSLPGSITATKRRNVRTDPALYAIRSRFRAAAGRRRHHQAARQHLLRHAACRPPHPAWRAHRDHLRREYIGLRSRVRGRCLFARLPCGAGRGMLLRPQPALAQGQSVRPAPQICRRDEARRGHRASRAERTRAPMIAPGGGQGGQAFA